MDALFASMLQHAATSVCSIGEEPPAAPCQIFRLQRLCRDMTKPNNYKNYVFENIGFVAILLSFYKETTKPTFSSFALKLLTVRTEVACSR